MLERHRESYDVPNEPSVRCASLSFEKRLTRHSKTDIRTTLNSDDQLLEEARRTRGVTEKAKLVREGLKAFIKRKSARRLARLGAANRNCN
jgi:hypothetical protein